jgi:polysaccharide biosynthesis/export protein
MRKLPGFLILTFFLSCFLFAQQDPDPQSAGSAEEILLRQAQNKQESQTSPQNLNEQIKRMVKPPKAVGEYLLGPGDVIELTVAGIPEMEKKPFPLDGQGNISVPYLGQVALLGLNARAAESELSRLYAVSLLEDPQVTLNIKEYRSQYYYVMGAVRQGGKYALTQSTDLLDALATAGGLTDKADSNIRIHRSSQQRSSGSSVPGGPFEINLTALLAREQDGDGISIFSGDVVEVSERKEKTYYVLGDILRPGAFMIDSKKRMHLSRALANAGGMLRTAAGKKVLIIRYNETSAFPEQIMIDAYAVLKGASRDIELCENDIVLVPGSASKTLGKSLLGGVTSLLGTLLLISQ